MTADSTASPYDRVGYRAVAVRPVSIWGGSWAVCRWTLKPLLRRWTFWGFVAIGMTGFLTNFALIYIKAEIAVQNEQLAKLIDRFRVTGTGEAYRDFLFFQARAVEILLAYFGVAGLVSDFRVGGINFYLSKPIDARHYAFGKLLAIALVLATLTLIPGLVLFLSYGLFSNSPMYWIEEWRLARGIVGYSAAIMAVDGLILLAFACWLRRPAALLLVWTAMFVALPALSQALEFQFRSRWFRLVNVWWDVGMLGAMSFGSLQDPKNAPLRPWVALTVGLIAVGCIWLIRRNLRAVESVS
jgi:ABC-type transport system involved in multi-copper enzyme maturation permease subunit